MVSNDELARIRAAFGCFGIYHLQPQRVLRTKNQKNQKLKNKWRESWMEKIKK
jgi:hypothetical protein